MQTGVKTKAHKTAMRVLAHAAAKHAAWQWRRFEALLDHCRDIQDQVLIDIVRTNQDSDFGRRHRFDQINSYDDFAKELPLARFSYFAPYVERCCAGDMSALFGSSQRVLMFALTSATTGPVKHIPVTSDFVAQYRRGWNIWGIKAIQDHPELFMGKVLQISSPAEEQRSKGGCACGAISGMLAGQQKWIVRKHYAVPPCVFSITDPLQRYYVIMRLAVLEDVRLIISANPSTLVALAQTANNRAEQMIREIHDGTMDAHRELPDECRRYLTCHLKPNPTRSRQLEHLLNKHGCLLPKHYWTPALLAHWTGGTVGCYLPRIREHYGDVPIRDIGLLASEGRMTIPLDNDTASGVLDIQGSFYEFVPTQEIDSLDAKDQNTSLPANLTVLRADELEEGQLYYLLLTNRAGLYRYHIGDIIRVTGFRGSTPMIEFVSRGAHACSITGEKLTEHQVVTAVNAALKAMDLALDTYTLVPVLEDPPYYTLYLESTAQLPAVIVERIGRSVDDLLQTGNIEYASKRKSQRIGPMRIQVMKDGELTRIDHKLILARGGRSEQFKHCFLKSGPFDPLAVLQESRIPAAT